MKLVCSIDMRKRSMGCSVGQTKKGKSVVSIGYMSATSKEPQLSICTKQDKRGSAFRIRNNLLKVHTKFVSEGKATISLNEPEMDICISHADKENLQKFLNALKAVLTNKEFGINDFKIIKPVTAKNVKNLQSSLSITDKKNYPIIKNFPSQLEKLEVSCDLKKIDNRIFQLKRLSTLNLSLNVISTLPEFNKETLQNLSTLMLNSNQLCNLPESIAVLKTLATVSLKSNNFTKFPTVLFDLPRLRELHLDDNNIQKVPNGIARLKRCLKELTLSNCSLEEVAADIRFLKLNHLDLSNNPKIATTYDFGSIIGSSEVEGMFPSLFELTASLIAVSEINTRILPKTLQKSLADYDYCIKCLRSGCVVMYETARYVWPLRKISAVYLAVNDVGCNTIITQSRICLRCASKSINEVAIIC
ncbi:DgyrCDS8400 [Dimorphilus gyrociliatus]|uniref:DgyrCDS8400 n=1 Tax=Dimorphilus gyrociliatus TaxID=2664684 RepID=A0A7I8VW90_9ANNE|nr:DgyrCDS8400 [Dimorphilus gyrociliatus]